MQEIINILKNYWPELLAILMFIGSFILQLIKKKPLNDIVSVLFNIVVDGVNYAENVDENELDPFNKSRDKRLIATSYVMVHLCDYYGLERTAKNMEKFERYRSTIVELIESMLSTPQKHDN